MRQLTELELLAVAGGTSPVDPTHDNPMINPFTITIPGSENFYVPGGNFIITLDGGKTAPATPKKSDESIEQWFKRTVNEVLSKFDINADISFKYEKKNADGSSVTLTGQAKINNGN